MRREPRRRGFLFAGYTSGGHSVREPSGGYGSVEADYEGLMPTRRTGVRMRDGNTASLIALPMRALDASLNDKAGSLSNAPLRFLASFDPPLKWSALKYVF